MALLISLLSLVAVTSAASWDYRLNGASTWAGNYPTCSGESQSPLDIVSSNAEEAAVLVLLEGYSSAIQFEMSNNGHTVGAAVPPGNVGQYMVEAPDAYNDLEARWSLLQFHFHWGSVNTKGSENTIDGKQYPMEVHFVHANTKYSSGHGDHNDGYLVLGFMFEIGAENAAFNKIVQTLTLIRNKGNTTMTADLSPNALIAGIVETDDFFYWPGSLTTPGCNEAVTWVLYRKSIVISQAQMNVFRNAIYENEVGDADEVIMVDNWRPVQALNSRTVYKNKINQAANDKCGASSLSACLLLLAASFLSSFFRR